MTRKIPLGGTRVIAYAIVDEDVRYTRRGDVTVDGKLLGAVPCLVICQKPGEEEILLLHCDRGWRAQGMSGGHRTVDEAKQCAEHTYAGLMEKWVHNDTQGKHVDEEMHQAFVRHQCAFCGRTPHEVEQMIQGKVWICNLCVTKFHAQIHA